MVPLLSACSTSWTEDYRKGAAALKADRFDEAERHLRSAIKSAKATNRPQAIAVAVLGLARAHMEQGEYGQARPLFNEAIKLFEQTDGRNSPQVAETLVELSACLYQEQLFADAEPLCLEALKIEATLAKPNLRTVGTAYNNLAEISKRRGDEQSAEDYYQKAIEAYKRDPALVSRLVDTYCNLAKLYKRQERFAMARGVADTALKTQKALAKQNDIALATVLNTVASIDRAQFDNHAAKAHYEEAIKILLPHEHKGADFEAALCDTLDNYADLQMDQRNLDVAEQTYLKAIKHCIESRGENHPCVAERKADLANLYRRVQKYKQAETLLKEALRIYIASYESESPIVINTINDLSAVYLDQKMFTEANRLYANWLPQLERELGPAHPHVADALENWAMVAEKSADQKQAGELRIRARAIRISLTEKSNVRNARYAPPARRALTLDADEHR
jgi:tetratricopeptide (TPR) repeat protein